MQEATPVGFGGMAAIITKGLDVKILDDAIMGLPLDIANINSSKQVVISGASEALPEAETRIKKAFTNKKDVFVIRLKVSAPFHSRFIRPIEKDFASILHENRKYFDAQKAVNVTSNYTGTFHTGEYEDLIRSLTLQIGHTVLWKDNMVALARAAGEIYEIGPKQHLGDFFKTMNINCKSVISLTSAQAIMNSQS